MEKINTVTPGRKFLTGQDTELQPWKQAISQGNRAFASGDTQRARANYEMALYSVKRVLNIFLTQPTATGALEYLDNVMAALVVTHHNIADLCRQDELFERAAEHLCEAHTAMYFLLHHPVTEITSLAQQHMKLTHSELLTFTQKHGDFAQITNTLIMTRFVCACCVRKTMH